MIMRKRISPKLNGHLQHVEIENGEKKRKPTRRFTFSLLLAGGCLSIANVWLGLFFLSGYSVDVLDASPNKNSTSNLRQSAAEVLGPPHKHAIPNVLIFTYSSNLLTEQFEFAQTSKEQLTPEQTELLALQSNVHNIIALHPTAQVRFLTDTDCVQSIRNMYAHNVSVAEELVQYFLDEPTGMFKADLCRGVALYETGGLYFDVDLGVRLPLFDVLKESTEFATVQVHRQSKHPGAFFQAFTAATPQHEVIRKYVELFLDYYRRHQPIGGPLGVMFLKEAYTAVKPDKVELWHEALYNPDLRKTILKDVPPPLWGYRRACKFIVITEPKVPVVVPLYSRIAGSRMCPERKTSDVDW